MRENLDPEDVCSEAEIWAALEAAEVSSSCGHVPADDQLKGIVNDLDEMMNADGGSLSRGQRQLLALARAILRRRKILALDGKFYRCTDSRLRGRSYIVNRCRNRRSNSTHDTGRFR